MSLMAAVQVLLALAILSLMLGTSAAYGAESRNSTASGSSTSPPVRCAPDITDTEAYKIEHPICARLAAQHQHNVQRPRCASVQGRAVNVTFHWNRDPSRAASALLAAVLRHVLGFQRVHLAPEKMTLAEFHRPDELVISLAEGVQDAFDPATDVSYTLIAYGLSHVPTRRRVHAWLTPVARRNSACRSDDWTFYSNLTALSLCGFIDPLPDSYYVNCSDPDDMSRRLDDLMQGPRALNILGVVSLAVEGAASASEAAAAHHVPLLLARAVPDQAARGASTWRAAGRLQHVALALHNFVAESGWTRVAVLSQPSTFARHYFTALQDKAKFFLRNFEIPLGLTEQLARKALQELQATKTHVVLVNTDSEAAALILATAVKLNMSYTNGFIWILREPQIRSENGTIYFTVSLSNQLKEGMSTEQLKTLGADGNRQFVAPHSVALADALMTLSTGFYNIFEQNPHLQNDLRSDKIIGAFNTSLVEKPVAGFDGVERHYKDRAVEVANVYLVKWSCSSCKPQRLATWRVNATSGSVRDEDGSPPTLNLDFSPTRVPDSFDCGVRYDEVGGSGVASVDSGGAGGKQHVTPTDEPANNSNTAFIVHQWIESITKIETTKSNLSTSDILNFHKLNQLKNLNTLN